MRVRKVSLLVSLVALLFICVQPVMASSDRGYLIVHVNPPETYVYADGEPVVESNGHYISSHSGRASKSTCTTTAISRKPAT